MVLIFLSIITKQVEFAFEFLWAFLLSLLCNDGLYLLLTLCVYVVFTLQVNIFSCMFCTYLLPVVNAFMVMFIERKY